MKIVWTETAVAQLAGIHAFIASDSHAYAQRTIEKLTKKSEIIASFPLAGRIVPEAGLPQIREVIEGDYRIIYHLRPDRIEILAVIHGSRQTPWSPDPGEKTTEEQSPEV